MPERHGMVMGASQGAEVFLLKRRDSRVHGGPDVEPERLRCEGDAVALRGDGGRLGDDGEGAALAEAAVGRAGRARC